MNINYKDKYIKYKIKYLLLKGGSGEPEPEPAYQGPPPPPLTPELEAAVAQRPELSYEDYLQSLDIFASKNISVPWITLYGKKEYTYTYKELYDHTEELFPMINMYFEENKSSFNKDINPNNKFLFRNGQECYRYLPWISRDVYLHIQKCLIDKTWSWDKIIKSSQVSETISVDFYLPSVKHMKLDDVLKMNDVLRKSILDPIIRKNNLQKQKQRDFEISKDKTKLSETYQDYLISSDKIGTNLYTISKTQYHTIINKYIEQLKLLEQTGVFPFQWTKRYYLTKEHLKKYLEEINKIFIKTKSINNLWSPFDINPDYDIKKCNELLETLEIKFLFPHNPDYNEKIAYFLKGQKTKLIKDKESLFLKLRNNCYLNLIMDKFSTSKEFDLSWDQIKNKALVYSSFFNNFNDPNYFYRIIIDLSSTYSSLYYYYLNDENLIYIGFISEEITLLQKPSVIADGMKSLKQNPVNKNYKYFVFYDLNTNSIKLCDYTGCFLYTQYIDLDWEINRRYSILYLELSNTYYYSLLPGYFVYWYEINGDKKYVCSKFNIPYLYLKYQELKSDYIKELVDRLHYRELVLVYYNEELGIKNFEYIDYETFNYKSEEYKEVVRRSLLKKYDIQFENILKLVNKPKEDLEENEKILLSLTIRDRDIKDIIKSLINKTLIEFITNLNILQLLNLDIIKINNIYKFKLIIIFFFNFCVDFYLKNPELVKRLKRLDISKNFNKEIQEMFNYHIAPFFS